MSKTKEHAHITEETKWPNLEDSGLAPREFNHVLDLYLTEGVMDSEAHERMSLDQKNVIQCLKRAFKRIKKD